MRKIFYNWLRFNVFIDKSCREATIFSGHTQCINKSINKLKVSYFTYLSSSPPWMTHQIWHRASSPGHNYLCQILYRSVQGFRFCRGQICPSPLTVAVSPLTQCSRYLWLLLTTTQWTTSSKIDILHYTIYNNSAKLLLSGVFRLAPVLVNGFPNTTHISSPAEHLQLDVHSYCF